MIVGMGMDIVELDRIRDSWTRFGDAFTRRILSAEEQAALPRRNPVPFLAARFAAKEAASKALGTGFSDGVWMSHISVASLPSGAPMIAFSGRALEVFESLGASRALVTLTHGRDVAGAVVILEQD